MLQLKAYTDYFHRFRQRYGFADVDLRGHVPRLVSAVPLNIEVGGKAPSNYCRSRGPMRERKGTGRDRRVDLETRRAEASSDAAHANDLLRTAAARALARVRSFKGDTRAVLQAIADAELLVFGGTPGSMRGDRPAQVEGLLKILGRYNAKAPA